MNEEELSVLMDAIGTMVEDIPPVEALAALGPAVTMALTHVDEPVRESWFLYLRRTCAGVAVLQSGGSEADADRASAAVMQS